MIRKLALIFFLVIVGQFSLADQAFDEEMAKAQVGDAEAQYAIGLVYAKGEGVKQDYKLAAVWLTKAAEQGYSGAQYILGLMYDVGEGVTQDDKQAINWLTKSAEQGSSDAQRALADKFYDAKDYKSAVYWLTKAAEQGVVEAQFNLGIMYSSVFGTGIDYEQAVKWLTKAADQGHVEAQYRLGYIQANRTDGFADYSKSFFWIAKAADQGHVEAQGMLGDIYYNGEGVLQNYKQALIWYTKAAEQGDAGSQFDLGKIYYRGLGAIKDYELAYIWSSLATTSAPITWRRDPLKIRDLAASELSPKNLELAQEKALVLQMKIDKNIAAKKNADTGITKRNEGSPQENVDTAYLKEETWQTISVAGCCTYQIPNTLEIQGGRYKSLNDLVRGVVLEVENSQERIVAQPKGINDFDANAMKNYSRIIVEIKKGEKGAYAKLDEHLSLSDVELQEAGKEWRSKVEAGWGLKILSWQLPKIVSVNGVDALLLIYSRTISDGPPVLVNMYTIQNNDSNYIITISYRESESALWEKDFGKVISTFKFNKR